MDFKDPFFAELDKIQSASAQAASDAIGEVSHGAEQKIEPQKTSESQPKPQSDELRPILTRIAADVARALAILGGGGVKTEAPTQSISVAPSIGTIGTIIEGVFDGTGMVGNDGKHYSMPPNYASKSKLVEGDTLKLTISPDGSFVYKQIHPIDRKRVMGVLSHDAMNKQFTVIGEDRSWKVLTASVTYFKGIAGDEAVILVPQDRESAWAAVEHIIKKY